MAFKKSFFLGVMIFSTASVAFVCYEWLFKNPLGQSEQTIQNRILKVVPLGSSPEAVQAFIKSNGWKQSYSWKGTTSTSSQLFFPGVNGVYVIGADLGHYSSIIWRINVDAYWGFDGAGRLVDLRVRKLHDAL